MNKLIHIYFIDGPWQGTSKIVHEEEVLRNRTYLVYIPTRTGVEKVVPTNTDNAYVEIVCMKVAYIPIPLPPNYGKRRFAMCLEQGLGQ